MHEESLMGELQMQRLNVTNCESTNTWFSTVLSSLLLLVVLIMTTSCSELNSTDPDEMDEVQWADESSSSAEISSSGIMISSSLETSLSSSGDQSSSSLETSLSSYGDQSSSSLETSLSSSEDQSSSSLLISSSSISSSSEQGVSSMLSSSSSEQGWCDISGNCGTVTDSRDGQVYNWTRIGLQVWMAENLNYDSGDSSMCYDDNPDKCEQYGRLYLWGNVMAGEDTTSNNPSGVQGICPDGWHLPSKSEWVELFNFITNDQGLAQQPSGDEEWIDVGMFLKSDTLWTINPGSDSYAYSALPSGWYQGTEGSQYRHEYENTGYYTSTQPPGSMPQKVIFPANAPYVDSESPEGVVYITTIAEFADGHYVRCVKN